MREDAFQVLVLDMQPIDPPVGGGRLRLLGLYHALGDSLSATYIGSYDWPGERRREQWLTRSLKEICVPLSPEHFEACEEWQTRVGGKTIIDSTFPALGEKSQELLKTMEGHLEVAEIVVFSHPWIYPLLEKRLQRGSTLVIYDSHNVEGLLRASLLDDGGFGSEIVRQVVATEHRLCHAADLVLACSHEDRGLFHDLYDIPFSKTVVVPNGTFTRQILVKGDEEKLSAKRRLGFPDSPLGIFFASAYGPNLEAADFILQDLAPKLPDATFGLCGSVAEGLELSAPWPPNVLNVGRVDEDKKLLCLGAADFAVNPMFSGSGTNIKMLDYLAAALPTVSTPIGARGIDPGAEPAFLVCPPGEFVEKIETLLSDSDLFVNLSRRARKLAEESYSWERISPNLGSLIKRARSTLETPPPFFSVIVPTYERHDHLASLFQRLDNQTFKDFEVIVVDQSQEAWDGVSDWPLIDVVYLKTDVKGAVKARNLALLHARGSVLAFTDDDCQPMAGWLEAAVRYFDEPEVIGVEGLITSDSVDKKAYRPVSNDGFEGIGFMTANLMIRRDVVAAINGFDERFDDPHFREDTDLAWRAERFGRIPFARDVKVFHPAHRRDVRGESAAERNRFFEKDPLLLRKHPQRYRELFLREAHYADTPGFRENFLRGADKYGVEVDPFFLTLLS